MNLLKLNLIAIASILTIGTNYAKTESEHAVISQTGNNKITLRAQADLEHPIRIEFTNINGDLVFEDAIFSTGTVIKTYDLSKTKIGEYNVAVYCDNENFSTAFISKDGVELANSHKVFIQ